MQHNKRRSFRQDPLWQWFNLGSVHHLHVHERVLQTVFPLRIFYTVLRTVVGLSLRGLEARLKLGEPLMTSSYSANFDKHI